MTNTRLQLQREFSIGGSDVVDVTSSRGSDRNDCPRAFVHALKPHPSISVRNRVSLASGYEDTEKGERTMSSPLNSCATLTCASDMIKHGAEAILCPHITDQD